MEVITAALVLGLLILVIFMVFRPSGTSKKPLPPGPSGLTFMWYMLRYRRDYVRMQKLAEYGEIVSSKLSGFPIVHLNSFRAVHEAFVGQAEVFSGRPRFPFFDYVTHESGIIFQDGPLWQEHRRHTLRLLRDLGVGRSGAEEIVSEECVALIEQLEASDSKGVNCQQLFTRVINNVIARLTYGERCGSNDPKFERFSQNLDATLHLSLIDMIPFMFPSIVKIPPLFWCFNQISGFDKIIDEIHGYIREKIRDHEQLLKNEDMDNFEPTNVCDAYLIERNKQEAANPGKHTYTEWQLIRNMLELFIAGTETTATSLTWAMLMLSLNPEIQKKAHKEIFEEIGLERGPRMTDRPRLHYLCALMDEVLRYSSLVASNVAHRVLSDTELLGYFIPKNATIQSNLYGIHRDPELWEHPERFYPEHFLSSDGNYKPSKYLIPFSIGKRACLGESLARMELFMALVSILQHFEVKLADPSADVDAILKGQVGALRHTLPHKILFTKLDAV